MSSRSITGRYNRLQLRIRASAHAGVLNAALIIASVSIFVKIVAILREMYVARVFGLADGIDAYVVALLPVTIAASLLASFNAALVPVYIRVLRVGGEKSANELVRGVSWPMLKLLVGISALLALAASPLLRLFAPGFLPWKHDLALRLYYEMLPSVALSGISAAWAAVLNARDRFALAAATPVMVPACVLGAVAFGSSSWGVDAIALGTTAGYLSQTVLLGVEMRRQGAAITPSRVITSAECNEVMGQYGPLVASALILQGSPIVDQVMASLLAPGSVAALGYGNRIAGQITSLITLAAGTAVLPAFSRLVAVGKWGAMRRHLKMYGVGILALTVPATIAFAVFSHPIVAVLYQRGAFTAADTDVVAFIQAMYVLQVPLYALGILFVKVIAAAGRTRIFVWGNLISVSLNAALDYLLMKRWGAGGIALSTSIVYSVSCTVLGVYVWYRLPRADVQDALVGSV